MAKQRKSPRNGTVRLSPTQEQTLQRLLGLWSCSPLFVLWGRSGLGRTTVLKEFEGRVGDCAWFDSRTWLRELKDAHPMKIEESFLSAALGQLQKCKTLIVDDFERLDCVVGRCNYHYPRTGLKEPVLQYLVDEARDRGKKVVISSTSRVADYVDARCLFVGIDRLTEEDYRTIFNCYLDENAGEIDVGRVFRFAPKLSIHQLRGALEVLRTRKDLTTALVMRKLEELKMASNINLGEVRSVELEDLKGVDDVIGKLKQFIITPLVEEELARSYGIRPKRGILLHGPPGTGKTTVGRALARRLRSRFFRIDGTFISRTQDFYRKISQVFENARDNAPALVFIDDCDTIFEDKDEFGLYRYLLTMLDGLESEEMAGVSVMMTAMDVSSIPPALIRSGRIELWLEMQKPDLAARQAILMARCRDLPDRHGQLDLLAVAEITDGFTGADLERTVLDAKTLIIAELASGHVVADATRYFLAAVEGVKSNLEVVARATQAAQARNMFRMPDPFARFARHGMDQSADDTPPTG